MSKIITTEQARDIHNEFKENKNTSIRSISMDFPSQIMTVVHEYQVVPPTQYTKREIKKIVNDVMNEKRPVYAGSLEHYLLKKLKD